MKEASSNKAARLLHGKTTHAANKLNGGSTLGTVHLRLSEKRAKVLGNVYSKIGGKVIDEHSQINAKLSTPTPTPPHWPGLRYTSRHRSVMLNLWRQGVSSSDLCCRGRTTTATSTNKEASSLAP